jgi:hypothetical protein
MFVKLILPVHDTHDCVRVSPVGPFWPPSPLIFLQSCSNESSYFPSSFSCLQVTKRRGEAYQLQWKEQADFVRLAAKCDALLVPFAALGADDAFDYFLDSDELLSNPVLGPALRGIYQRLAPDLPPESTVYPIAGVPLPGGGPVVPSLLPVPSSIQRVYFQFRPPIDPRDLLSADPNNNNNATSSSAGPASGEGLDSANGTVGGGARGRMLRSKAGRTASREEAAKRAEEVYQRVRSEVLLGLEELKEYRERDPGRDPWRRLATEAAGFLPDLGLLQRRRAGGGF